jgi:hypothetical protein
VNCQEYTDLSGGSREAAAIPTVTRPEAGPPDLQAPQGVEKAQTPTTHADAFR